MGKLNNYLKGIIYVKLISNTPERFLNICNANAVHIWNLNNENEEYFFEMFPDDFYRLKAILRKTNSKVSIVSKWGLPFELYRYRSRNCFVIGIMLAFFLVYLVSMFTWDISFVGNQMVTDDVLLKTLKSAGVYHGIMMKNISCDDTEKIIRNEFDEITWVSVEKTGTRLIVHIKENDEDYVVADKDDKPCDLTATKDGVITRIITRNGTPQVKVGDAVTKGTVLVSGVVNVYDDYGTIIDSMLVHADADISISTYYEYEDELKEKYTYKIYSGKESRKYYIEFFDSLIKLGIDGKYDNYERIIYDYQLRLGKNFYLPIHLGSIVARDYVKETGKYELDEAKEILDNRLSFFLDDLNEKGVQIIEKDVKIENKWFGYTYSGKIYVVEPAYIQSKIEQTDDNIGELDERN